MAHKFTLYVSSDCGQSYTGTNLLLASPEAFEEFLKKHKSLAKKRWCLENEDGEFACVCDLFMSTWSALKENNACMVSNDPKLAKFLAAMNGGGEAPLCKII